MILMRGLYKNNVILMINCHLKQGFEMLVYWYQYPPWCLLYEKKKKKKLLVILLCPPLRSHAAATSAIVSLHSCHSLP